MIYEWVRAKRAYRVITARGAFIGYVWQFNGAWHAHPTLDATTQPHKGDSRDAAAAMLSKTSRKTLSSVA